MSARKAPLVVVLVVLVLTIAGSGYLLRNRNPGTQGSMRSSAVTSTAKVRISPIGEAGTLRADFSAGPAVASAICRRGSAAVGEAYRCFDGNRIYDPCWAETRGSLQSAVLCMLAPWERKAVRLRTRALEPLAENDAESDDFPWGLTLDTGNQCQAVQGAHDQFNGRAVDYVCDGGLYVLRGLDRGQPLWWAQTVRRVGGRYSSGPVQAISKAWYGGEAITSGLAPQYYAFSSNEPYSAAGQRVGIATGRYIVGWIPGAYPQVSSEGRYVISSTDESVHVFATRDRKQYQRKFAHRTVGMCRPQIVGEDLLYIAEPNLVLYHLPNFSSPRRLEVFPGRSQICPLGHIGTDVLVAVHENDGWRLYLVSTSGIVTRIGAKPQWPATAPTDTPSAQNITAVADRTRDGGPRIAYTTWSDERAFSIHLLDPRTGKSLETDMRQLGLRKDGHGRAQSVYVQDMWWGQDGALYATMTSGRMSGQRPDVVVSAQSLWRLDGLLWMKVISKPLIRIRPVSKDSQILVQIERSNHDPGVIGTYWGRLYFRAHRQLYLINKSVYDITTPPYRGPLTKMTLSY